MDPGHDSFLRQRAGPEALQRMRPDSRDAKGRVTFVELVTQLCACASGLEPTRLCDGYPFLYRGHLVSLSHAPSLAPGFVIVHMTLTVPAKVDEAAFCALLLRANQDLHVHGRGYSISPWSQKPVYSESIALDCLCLRLLLDALDRILERIANLV